MNQKIKIKITPYAVHKLIVCLNRAAQELMEECAYFTHKVIVRNGGREYFSDLYMQCLAYLCRHAQKPKGAIVSLSLQPEWAIIVRYALQKQLQQDGILSLVGDGTNEIYVKLDQNLLTV